jgi:hypothetical protein
MENLKVPSISGMKQSDIRGLLLSFLTTVTEVTEGQRKVSYLSHFYRERLNRFEKKKLILILNHFISQLSEENGKTQIRSSVDSQEERIPKHFSDFFQFFQNFTR